MKDGQLLRVKFIKTEADLPGKEGLYPCYADGKGLCWFGVPQNHKYEWMSKVKWYIKPTEEQESKEDQYRKRLNAGRDFLMTQDPRYLTVEDCLEVFGFTRDGLNEID